MSTANNGRSPFGALLRQLRLRAGLSQDELAERARMSTDGVGALERGLRKTPYRETVDLLADALGATAAEREQLREAAQRPRRMQRAIDAPPKASVPCIAGDIPSELTPLRGRERALEDLRALVTHRLVTIVGSGGIGKTRLAAALCRDASLNAGDVWFVRLEALTENELVAATAARTVGAILSDEAAPEDAVARALAGRTGLLVLDNCEHVTHGVTRLIAEVLAACPRVHVVATSRRPLGIRGEALYRLASLDVPPPATALSATDALAYGSIALFVDRAMGANSNFVLRDEDAPVVADICRRLDGIALAIQLAAARTVVLTVPGLAARLDERFRLLTAGSRTAMPRQRTLSAMIDWSYDLLSPAERTLIDRASIFAGTFDLRAAHAVCSEAGDDEYAVLDLLSSLIDQSLVVADTASTRERYRLLESTREYAHDRLDASGEHEIVALRHAEHFAAVAREADATWGSIDATAWLAAIEDDTNNFRRALDRAAAPAGDVALGAEIAGALQRFWTNAGLEVEGRAHIGRFLQRIDEIKHPAIAARLWRAEAWLRMLHRKHEAAVNACRLYESIGDDGGLADSLRQRAIALMQMGNVDEAAVANDRALATFRALGDRRSIANCLDVAGMLARGRGDVARARPAYEEALALFRAIGSDGGVASVLTGLAEVASLMDDFPRAVDLMLEARAIHTTGRYLSNMAQDAMVLCALYTTTGDLDKGLASLADALRWAQAASNESVLATSLLYGAVLVARRGDLARAAGLMGYARMRRAQLHAGVDESERRLLALYEARADAGLDAATAAALEAAGAAWSEDFAIARALLEAPEPERAGVS